MGPLWSWRVHAGQGKSMRVMEGSLGSCRVHEGHGGSMSSKEVSMKFWLGSWGVGRLRIRLMVVP